MDKLCDNCKYIGTTRHRHSSRIEGRQNPIRYYYCNNHQNKGIAEIVIKYFTSWTGDIRTCMVSVACVIGTMQKMAETGRYITGNLLSDLVYSPVLYNKFIDRINYKSSRCPCKC